MDSSETPKSSSLRDDSKGFDRPRFASLLDLVSAEELKRLNASLVQVFGYHAEILDSSGSRLISGESFPELCRTVRSSSNGESLSEQQREDLAERVRLRPDLLVHNFGIVSHVCVGAVPIVIDGKHCGAWIIGPVIVAEIDEQEVDTVAAEIEVPPDRLRDGIIALKTTTEDELRRICGFVETWVEKITQLALENLVLHSANAEPRAKERVATELGNEVSNLIDNKVVGYALHEMIFDSKGRPVDYRFLAANPAFEALTGLEVESVIGRRVTEVLPDIERDWIDLYGKVVTGHEIASFERYNQSLQRHFLVNAFRTSSNRFVTIFLDVTESRDAEKMGREVIACAGEGVIFYDHELRPRLWNRAMEGLTGIPANQVLDTPVTTIFPFVNRVDSEDVVAKVRAGRRVTIDQTYFEISSTSCHGWVSMTYTPHYTPSGNIGGIIAVARDETRNREMNERLRQSEKMEALGQIAGGVAHDFNNQLSAILGYAEILEMQLDDEKLSDFAARIATAASRSADLTTQLLDFSRKHESSLITVDIHSVLREVTSLLRRSIDKKIQVTTRFGDRDAHVLGNDSQLQNAFLNIALNGRDAMPDGGELTFTTEILQLTPTESEHELEHCGDHCVEITIADTGIGMDESVRTKVFEPFFTTKKSGRGTGLGLATTYGVIESHGGVIQVDSEPGQGTTFRIRLPLIGDGLCEAEIAEAAVEGSSGARILVVEDEVPVREMMNRLLGIHGHRVIACENSAAALDHFKMHWPGIDLVILDMVMPGLDGNQVFEAMREIDPLVKVLVCTGYSQRGRAEQILSASNTAFLQKPFRARALHEKVHELLSTPKHRD